MMPGADPRGPRFNPITLRDNRKIRQFPVQAHYGISSGRFPRKEFGSAQRESTA
jgi:hypothetical protein